ncbi:hypothetical protein ACMFMG_011489 [Clarireedia jacksonii]
MSYRIQDLNPSHCYQQSTPPLIQDTYESSMLYSLLPNVVQSRLPRIPSIRSSVGFYGTRNTPSTGTTTPEAGYQPSMIYEVGKTAISSDSNEIGSYFADETLYSEEDISQTRTRRDLLGLHEMKSGIAWKFAKQGKLLSFFFVCDKD